MRVRQAGYMDGATEGILFVLVLGVRRTKDGPKTGNVERHSGTAIGTRQEARGGDSEAGKSQRREERQEATWCLLST